MSSKLHKIPHFNTYDDIRAEMQNDLQYRLANRTDKTSLGGPLYYRINVQLILTQECPYNCPFCLERKNPMQGDNNFKAQIESLKRYCRNIPMRDLQLQAESRGYILTMFQNLLIHTKSIVTMYFVQSILLDIQRNLTD